MIEFNINDTNLTEIKRESKLFNLETKHNYRIYGLKNKDNPPILISCTVQKMDEALEKQIKAFFKIQGLDLQLEDDEEDKQKVFIGLRSDIRDHILLSVGIVQTIIYTMEGKLSLDISEYKVGKLPKFNAEMGEE